MPAETTLLPAAKRRWWLRWSVLPLVVWLLVLVCSLYTDLPIYHHDFGPDPDNAMRADQVRDWLQGQGWFDTAQHRLDVHAGAINGGPDAFSRLADLPLAAVALAARPFIATIESAILIGSFVLPLCLLLPLALWLAGWAMRPLFGAACWLATPLVCFPDVLAEFLPGRIDHHAYQILLALAGLGAVLRLAAGSDQQPHRRWGALLGLYLALSIALGAEGLIAFAPLLAGSYALLWRDPRRLAAPAIAFAITASAAAVVLLLALRTPDQFMVPTLYVFSLLGVKLVLAAALVFTVGSWLAPRIAPPGRRAAALAAVALLLTALLLADTPGLLRGPWLGFDPWLVAFTKARVGEMQPLARYADIWPWFEGLLVLMLLGFACGWRRHPAHRDALRLLIPTALLLGLAALFFAARLDRSWWVFALPGYLFGLQALGRGLRRLQLAGHARPRLNLALALLLAVLPPVIILTLRFAPIAAGPALAAAPRPAALCPQCLAADYLTIAYPAPQRILANGSSGPRLVWGTPHTVIGGGIYNVGWGLKLAQAVFTTTDLDAAARLLRDERINLLFVKNFGAIVHPVEGSLLQRLARGAQLAWVRPVAVPLNDGSFTLYEIDQAALAAGLQ